VVLVLLAGIAACGVLYLTDTIKLWEAGVGAGAVAAVSGVLALAK
jgi:hypothetical protein